MATCRAEQEAKMHCDIKGDCIRVRVPRITSNEQYLEVLDQLLRLNDEHMPNKWIIDLSEQDRIPLAFTSLLLGFGERARSQGCEVRFTGIRTEFLPQIQKKQQLVRCFGLKIVMKNNECEILLQGY